jgi:nucleoside-diphosphate-sugar epimerase
MTVLVTGAAGFLGGHVIDVLLERGDRPRALIHPCDQAERLEAAGVDVRRGDVASLAPLTAAVKGVDIIVHCAARTGPWGLEQAYMQTNVTALEPLVDAAQAAGVQRIVHVSSITVHGNDVGGWADEEAPFREEPNPYSRSKIAGERLLERMVAERRAPVTIVRPGWIYGPRDVASTARIARMLEARRMFVIGSGDNHLPLIYVRDVAEGVLLASQAPAAVGRAYLLVNDEPVTQHAFLATLAAELGVPPPTRRIPYELVLRAGALSESLGRLARSRRPPPVMRYGLQLLGGENRFAISRARAELGFLPAVNLRDGVKRTAHWYRDAVQLGGDLKDAA